MKRNFTKYPVFASKQPKWWNSSFATKVIDAYKSGELTLKNIYKWEQDYADKYNNGSNPGNFGTRQILEYHIKTGKDPRDVKSSVEASSGSFPYLVKIGFECDDPERCTQFITQTGLYYANSPEEAEAQCRHDYASDPLFLDCSAEELDPADVEEEAYEEYELPFMMSTQITAATGIANDLPQYLIKNLKQSLFDCGLSQSEVNETMNKDIDDILADPRCAGLQVFAVHCGYDTGDGESGPMVDEGMYLVFARSAEDAEFAADQDHRGDRGYIGCYVEPVKPEHWQDEFLEGSWERSYFDSQREQARKIWETMSAADQTAAEYAAELLDQGYDLESAANEGCMRADEGNVQPEYETEEFYGEEADFNKVFWYLNYRYPEHREE